MSKHTPGPWTVDPVFGLDVRGADGNDLAIAINREMNDISIKGRVTVGPATRADAQANARLIAAAPELLEALRKIRDRVGIVHSEPMAACFDVSDIACAAIAKAQS